STFRSRKDVPRDVSGKGNASNSHAIHAPSMLRTASGCPATGLRRWGRPVYPFLRAHEPNLPGPGIPREPWPAIFLIKYSLPPPRQRPEWKGTKPVVRQFTNRRMRTFIATPSARKVNKTEDPP